MTIQVEPSTGIPVADYNFMVANINQELTRLGLEMLRGLNLAGAADVRGALAIVDNTLTKYRNLGQEYRTAQIPVEFVEISPLLTESLSASVATAEGTLAGLREQNEQRVRDSSVHSQRAHDCHVRFMKGLSSIDEAYLAGC